MKRYIPAGRNVVQAFTLIEMLVVIAIIGILASMLLVGLSRAKTSAQKKICQAEEGGLVAAIQQYNAQYSRLPASTNAVNAAQTATPNSNDFTFGTLSNTAAGGGGQLTVYTNIVQTEYGGGLKGGGYQNYNSEVIAILRDDNFFPEAMNNVAHIYNPQQTPFFQSKAGVTNIDQTGTPGIGQDDILRDIWGNPYMITLDLNYDGKCFDYALNKMYQLNSPTPSTPLWPSGEAIVWSYGPFWKTVSYSSALNTGVNKQTLVMSFQ